MRTKYNLGSGKRYRDYKIPSMSHEQHSSILERNRLQREQSIKCLKSSGLHELCHEWLYK